MNKIEIESKGPEVETKIRSVVVVGVIIENHDRSDRKKKS